MEQDEEKSGGADVLVAQICRSDITAVDDSKGSDALWKEKGKLMSQPKRRSLFPRLSLSVSFLSPLVLFLAPLLYCLHVAYLSLF